MRFFIEFSYNGSNYHGWQRQPSQTSIQERFEDCISKILSSNISLTAAGRTDTGVHAKKMFAHFDYDKEFDSIDELIDDIASSGMDPNYEITCNGINTGELAIELLPF